MSSENEVRTIEPGRAAGGREPLPAARLARAKAGFTTRRVPMDAARTLLTGAVVPRPGDLLLARVDRVRQHARIELADGRRAHLFPGDEVVVCAGNRYAPDQFHAVAPERLGPCSLVAAGGIAARVLDRHAAMKPATEITALGVLADDVGRALNLARFAIPGGVRPADMPVVTAVLGTSMNSGKTAAASHLIRGLDRAGRRVGSAKVTGTGAGGDLWRARDAGAAAVVDFTDAGHASTYCLRPHAIEAILDATLNELARLRVDAIVIEIADGLLHLETARLVASSSFRERVDHVLFAATDAMGAIAGGARLVQMGLPLRALSGAFTQSPLATREVTGAVEVPIVDVATLAEPDCALSLVAAAPRAAWAAA